MKTNITISNKPANTLTTTDYVIRDGCLEKYVGHGGDVVIPDSVTEIGSLAFRNCTSLTSVTIHAGVTSIGWCAFSGCDNLRHVRGLKRKMNVDPEAFYGSLWENKKNRWEVPMRVLIVVAIIAAIIFGGAALLAAFTDYGYGTALIETAESVGVIGFITLCGLAPFLG